MSGKAGESEGRIDHCLQLFRAMQPDLCFDGLSVFKDDQRRQVLDSVPLSQTVIVRNVHFDNLCSAGVVVCQFVDNWTQFATGPSRRGPEVHENRNFRFQYFHVKIAFVQIKSHWVLPRFNKWLLSSRAESTDSSFWRTAVNRRADTSLLPLFPFMRWQGIRHRRQSPPGPSAAGPIREAKSCANGFWSA